MIGDKKVVVVTPAGRKKYMEILIKYILREKNIVDEYRIWVNTKNSKDIAYFKELATKHKGFITLDERFINEEECGSNFNIHRFFDKCIDEDTIYVRLDDDVVWLQPNCIENLVKYRIENPEPFLIYGTIINNGIVDSLLQNFGYYNNNDTFNYQQWLSVDYPKEIKTPNIIFGGAYCSHFAFHPQREYMDKTTILDEYKQLSEYLDININDYDFTKIQWNKLSNETKLFIYQILKENNSL
jgi:hypothetical protein